MRDVVAHPFFVRRDDGLVVRVEPGPSPLLQAALPIEEQSAWDRRSRVARLLPGARVQVEGELTGTVPAHPEAVYREGPSSLFLRPPPGGRLAITTEPPGQLPGKRAVFHVVWAAVAGLLLSLYAGTALREFVILTLDGTQVQATTTGAETWRVWVKPKNSSGYWQHHWAVRAKARVDGADAVLEDECGGAVYTCAKAGTCPRLPFVVSDHFDEHHLGPSPTLHTGVIALLVLTALILGIAYPAHTVGSRPWYLRKKVRDTGSGRLAPH
jgi:hypothetical protein